MEKNTTTQDENQQEPEENSVNPNPETESTPSPKPEKKQSKPRSKKKAPPVEETPAEDLGIKDGINDLSNLPIKLLQLELISRGYHEGVIMRLDKPCLTNIIRDSTNLSFMNSSRSGKIFTEDAETETQRLEKKIENDKNKQAEKSKTNTTSSLKWND